MNSDFFSIDDNSKIEDLNIAGSSIKELIKKSKFRLEDFASYIPLRKSVLKEKDISMIYLGFYERWDPQECFYYSVEKTGFRPQMKDLKALTQNILKLTTKWFLFIFTLCSLSLGLVEQPTMHAKR